MPTRPRTTHFLLSFVLVLVLAPALVWGIKAINQDSPAPATSDVPAATADEPQRHGSLGCEVITAPDSAAERAAACETEPPRVAKQRDERPEPRQGRLVSSAVSATEACTAACETGTIESAADGVAPVETTDEAREIVDVVGAIPPLARAIPIDRLDEVEERLGRVVDETLGEIEVPDEAPDVPAEVLEDALVPDGVEIPPAIEIQIDPAPTAPTTLPDPPAAVDPPAAPAPDPVEEQPAASDASELTALLVTDKETAEDLGIPRRMTITLSPQVMRALAILSERKGLELTAAAADSPAPSRD